MARWQRVVRAAVVLLDGQQRVPWLAGGWTAARAEVEVVVVPLAAVVMMVVAVVVVMTQAPRRARPLAGARKA